MITTMSERKHISLKVKLAAALLKAYPAIPHEEAKKLTADQIIARFHFDHWPIPHAHGGPDEPWNLVPLPVDEHRHKTAKKDVPQIAKTKRITREHEEFRKRLLTPRDERPPKKRTIQSRGFQNRRKN